MKDLQAAQLEGDLVIFASGSCQLKVPVSTANRGQLVGFMTEVNAAMDFAKAGCGAASSYAPINRMKSPPPHTGAYGPRSSSAGGSSRSALHDRGGSKKVNGLGKLTATAAAVAAAASPPRPARPTPTAGTTKPPPPLTAAAAPAKPKASSSSSSSSLGLPELDSRSDQFNRRGGSGKGDLVAEAGRAFGLAEESDDDISDIFFQKQPQQSKPPARPASTVPAYPRKTYDRNKFGRASHPPARPSSSSFSWPPATTTSSFSSSSSGKREGLRNLGNTCYLNATVQALAAAAGFGDDLLSSFWLREAKADLLLAAASAQQQQQQQQQQGKMTTRHNPPPPTPALPARVYGSLVGLLLRLRSKGHGVLDPTPFRQVSQFR